MPIFIVPYEWAVCGEIEVEAETAEEAAEQVDNMNLEDLDCSYIDGSWTINFDVMEVINKDDSG